MKIDNLESIERGTDLDADVVIVGGGPAAYAIARELRNDPLRVLILESGVLAENAAHDALNALESIGEPLSPERIERRRDFHSENTQFWSHEAQGFGVRCRVLGGSTEAWAGKSAAFDAVDFAPREWVPYSGWPLDEADMKPFVDRAAEALNLGPNCYDKRFWEIYGSAQPGPALDSDVLRSYFWQFSRSRADRLDFMRIKREFETLDAPNLRILVNATVVGMRPSDSGASVSALEVSTLAGDRRRVRAKTVVLAAGAIENPRLMMAAERLTGHPFGNQNGLVGRFLMDHPSATIGRFAPQDCAAVTRRFGFYGLNHDGQTHMYMHGVALSPELQRRERLLNCAAYMMEERAPDDPWGALRRLVRINSARPLSDLLTVLAGSSLVLKGMAAHLLTDGGLPKGLTGPIIETLVRHAPNSVVREYRGRGLPHKLAGVSIDAITEQAPNPDSRITLSEDVDPLGVPRAKVDWRIDGEAYHAMIRMGQVLARELPKVGLPTPILPNWVAEERPDLAPVIDMAHSAGTTRMSNDPRQGVVDADGAVFGLNNLYIAGASVFPTSGHANPTLMIMAMSIRLADHLRAAIKQPVVLRVAQRSAGAVRPGAVLPAAAQRAGEKSRRRIKSDL